MNSRKLAVLVVLVLTLSFASVAKAGSTYTVGDVFLGTTSGVIEYHPDGTFVQIINGGGLSGFTTGMSFQDNGNLLATDFSTGTVAQYDNAGNLITGTFLSGATQVSPESIAIDKAGNIYVGDASQGVINEYSKTGAFISSTAALTEDRGTDWIDLAADQKTIVYTSEGHNVMSVTAGGAQNPNFSTGQLTGSAAYALRIIPAGAFAGDVLVADSGNAILLDASGNVLTTYTLPGNGGGDFALNLDGNGTDFWTADFATGMVWEVNIATGAIDNSWLATCDSIGDHCGGSNVFGLVVLGQLTSSGGGGGGGNVPEPGTLTLLAGGLLSLGGFAKRRLLRA